MLYLDSQGRYWDDMSDKQLDAEEVERANLKEMAQIHEHKVYTKVPIEDGWRDTGKPPIRDEMVAYQQGR